MLKYTQHICQILPDAETDLNSSSLPKNFGVTSGWISSYYCRVHPKCIPNSFLQFQSLRIYLKILTVQLFSSRSMSF